MQNVNDLAHIRGDNYLRFDLCYFGDKCLVSCGGMCVCVCVCVCVLGLITPIDAWEHCLHAYFVYGLAISQLVYCKSSYKHLDEAQ